MFIALDILPQKSGRLRSFFVRPKAYLEQAFCCGVSFAVLRAEKGKNGVDWATVENICGSYCNRVLMPENTILPKKCKIKKPALPNFEAEVIAKTACKIIAGTSMPLYKRTIGIVDFDAEYGYLLKKLLAYFSNARVVTNNAGGYEKYAEQMMEELGASVTVFDDLAALDGSALVISPAPVKTSRALNFNCPVITGGDFICGGKADIISSLRVCPAEELTEKCPPGIDLHIFAGALYEFCGLRDIDLTAKTMLFNYRRTNIKEAIDAVKPIL